MRPLPRTAAPVDMSDPANAPECEGLKVIVDRRVRGPRLVVRVVHDDGPGGRTERSAEAAGR